MSASKPDLPENWVDPDDAPEWTDAMWDRAEVRVGDRVVREATGTVSRAGRPTLGDRAKRQVTLRLDPEVLAHFRSGGAGWQTRIGEVLAAHVGAKCAC